MTEVQKLQKELNEMNAKRKAVIADNTVACDSPALKRTYTYRKSPAIKASDLAL